MKFVTDVIMINGNLMNFNMVAPMMGNNQLHTIKQLYLD